MDCTKCIWKSSETCKECRTEDLMRNIKTIITEEQTEQTEQRLRYLLEDKAELERQIRVGEHARMEIIEVNRELVDCYKSLIEKSPLE